MVDIGNAYLNAPYKKGVYVKYGAELFGAEHEGKKAVIVRVLYGLASAGNLWWHHLSTAIRTELGFDSSKADPDFYRRMEKHPDMHAYYTYLIVYVDDVMCVHHNPKSIMDKIGKMLRLKDRIASPTMYLGNDVRPWEY